MRSFAFSLLCVAVALGAGCTQTPASNGLALVDVADDEGAQMEALDTLSAEEESVLVVDDAAVANEVFAMAEGAAPITLAVHISATNFMFSPSSISVTPGQEVAITFSGIEGTHSFVIEEMGINESIREGQILRFIAPSTPGVYAFYCGIGSHHALGMEGTLLVR